MLSEDVGGGSAMWRNAAIFAAVLLVAFGIALVPGWVDRPLFVWLNSHAATSHRLDMAFILFSFMTTSSLPFVALVWSCWFAARGTVERGKVAVGLLVAFGAGIVSRMLQYTLPTHPRPALDPAITFRLPFDVDPTSLNTWNSFPSDHATVLAGLMLVNFTVGAPWRWAAAALLVLTEASRIYIGAHYPSDVLGGLGLAGMLVWAGQAPAAVRWGTALARWEKRSAPAFYFVAFCLSYQIVTLFSEPRFIATLIFRLRHLP